MSTGIMQTRGEDGSYPYAQSKAAIALSDALRECSESQGLSLRTIAGRLGYRSAVVVSHMRTGRLPIPVERAHDIAEAVNLDPRQFVALVLDQRFPGMNFRIGGPADSNAGSRGNLMPSEAHAHDITRLTGTSLGEMSTEHLSVIREVAADFHPRRRWLTVAESAIMSVLRETRPELMQDGLTPRQLEILRGWAVKLK